VAVSKANKIRDWPAAPPAPRASRPVPRVPENSDPIRVDLPLNCPACEQLKKG
jgi:hypothetical protein